MKIRQLVRKVNKSLGENPRDWYQGKLRQSTLQNSRGIIIYEDGLIALKDKWAQNLQFFYLNDKEKGYISSNLSRLMKPVNKIIIEKYNKRRGWLVREILKTL